jgi:ribose transport system substrate-binding protein
MTAPGASQQAGDLALPKNAWIAVIPKVSTVDYWKLIHEGARRAGLDLGVKVVWLQPTATLSQPKIIADCIAKHASGIVLSPLSDKELADPVKKAEAANIPVVLIDTGFKNIPVVGTVATDNYRAGGLAGQRVIELLGGKGSVVLMRCSKEAEGTTEREKGLIDTLKDSGVKVLSDTYYGGNWMATAEKTALSLINDLNLANIPNTAVVTVSATNTEAMLTELKATKLAGKVKFVGFDSSEKLLAGLHDCVIDALVVQNPQQIGYLGVKTMASKLSGQFVDPETKTDAMLVDRDNVGNAEVKALVTPTSSY